MNLTVTNRYSHSGVFFWVIDYTLFQMNKAVKPSRIDKRQKFLLRISVPELL